MPTLSAPSFRSAVGNAFKEDENLISYFQVWMTIR